MSQSDSAAAEARRIRRLLIDLSHELAADPSSAVIRAWAAADQGMFELVRALEATP